MFIRGEKLLAKVGVAPFLFYFIFSKFTEFFKLERISLCVYVCVSVISLRGCTVYSHVGVYVCPLMTL